MVLELSRSKMALELKQLFPIPSMYGINVPTFGWFLYHTWMLWVLLYVDKFGMFHPITVDPTREKITKGASTDLAKVGSVFRWAECRCRIGDVMAVRKRLGWFWKILKLRSKMFILQTYTAWKFSMRTKKWWLEKVFPFWQSYFGYQS